MYPSTVDAYLAAGCGRCPLGGTPQCKVHTWTYELHEMRRILQESGLTEEVKWQSPCYTRNGKNLVMIGAFKDNCVMSFLNGALMTDPYGLLVKPGENSKVARVVRIRADADMKDLAPKLADLVREAIRVDESGVVYDRSQDQEPELPVELVEAFADEPDFETAFYALTPGRQRSWILHFTSAKQSSTRASRVQAGMANIRRGKGHMER
jgi:uncharacterized protein YdeI (YjbR/CyaY-like superfamily)